MSRYGDERVQAFPDVDDVGEPHPRRGVPAVRDEQPGTDGTAWPSIPRRPSPGAGAAVMERRLFEPHCSVAAGASSNSRGHRHQDEHLLPTLAADVHHHDQAGAERADNGPDRVRGVHAADQPAGILAGRRHGRPAPSGKLAPHRIAPGSTTQTPHEVELEVEPGIRRDRRIDRPVRQRGREHQGRPAQREAQQHLTPAQRRPRIRAVARHARRRCCCRCPARRETRRGSARTCTPSRQTSATAAASR